MSLDSDLTDIFHQSDRQSGALDPTLPSPRPEPSQQLDAKALTVWRIGAAIGTLPFWAGSAIAATISWYNDLLWPLALVTFLIPLLITILQAVIIPPIEWRRWRYEISEREVDLQRGVFVVTRTLIPISRVQHVDTQQGPLMRFYGLATVTIATAGGVHEIPGLAIDVADEVRDRIAALAGVADDV